MATQIELKNLFKAAIAPDVTKFSQEEADRAAINAILETYNLKDVSVRQIRAHEAEIFTVIEQVVEELLPKAIEDVIGAYAEVKTFGRDEKVTFKINGLGKARARLGIVPGARGGIYKARRLDSKTFEFETKVETIGVFVTLEEILTGKVSLAELMANIRDGFVERIYIQTMLALRTAKTVAPKANIITADTIDEGLDKLIRIAGAYGNPIILGFREAIAKINNGATWTKTPSIAAADADDIRKQGYVAMYKGTPVVELPNYLVDENNSGFIFKENDVFILPAGIKPVKVAMQGDLTIIPTVHPSGSQEENAHRLIGVGLLLANNVCIFTDNEIKGGKY